MAEILILDPNEGAMEKYKAMLKGMEQEYSIVYTSYPEQAIELLSERQIAVVLSEDDMEILNAVELSEMINVMHPEIVQLLMTEVSDITKTLSTLNSADIYEVLLKPFKFAEDLEEPLRRAMQEYERRGMTANSSNQARAKIYDLDMEYDRIKKERIKRSRDYSCLFSALSGIVEGNLSTWTNASGLSEQDKNRLKDFILQIVKEYVEIFIFGNTGFDEYCKKLEDKYGNDPYGSTFHAELHCKTEIPVKRAKELYFAVALMEHLCQCTLMKYQIRVSVDISGDFYVMRFLCDQQESMIRGNMVYREDREEIRTVMHEITERCMKKIYTKSVKGYKGNPYVAAVTVLME